MADDLFTHDVAFAHHQGDGVFRQAFLFDVHDGVVEAGIKGLVLGGNLGDAHLFQRFFELFGDQLHALLVFFVGALLLQRPVQIVQHGRSCSTVMAWASEKTLSRSFWERLR